MGNIGVGEGDLEAAVYDFIPHAEEIQLASNESLKQNLDTACLEFFHCFSLSKMLCNLSFEVRIFIKLLTVGNCQFSLKKKKKKNSVTGLNQAVV